MLDAGKILGMKESHLYMFIFQDLSPEDVSRDLYLTCHIIQPDFKEKKGNSVPVRRPYGCGGTLSTEVPLK